MLFRGNFIISAGKGYSAIANAAYRSGEKLFDNQEGRHYLVFDQENDVIAEVYNSWYEYFRVARELIKDLPIEKVECASELIELATNVLNNGLRPHLT